MPRQGFHGLYIISIHTPTKGATNKTYIDSVTTMISIHTPTKGATYHAYKYTDILEFQSTLPPHSHKGSDELLLCFCIILAYFNPHSHKGSDDNSYLLCHIFMYFNPHSHKGSDISPLHFFSR